MANDQAEMYDFVRELFPLNRSLTGDGVRDTLRAVATRVAPLQLVTTEVPTGTKVLDWEIPNEWNLRRAFVEGPDGELVIDTANSNLHVLGYSEPVDKVVELEELQEHLYSLPDRPHAIPYRTSYYKQSWGFCLSHNQRESLRPGKYRVVVEATLQPGSLTYAEAVLPGETDQEILVVSHVCHPSLCNDNLAGLAVAVELLKELSARNKRRHTFRFLFAPVTLGAITWLSREARDGGAVQRIAHGLVLTGLGDSGPFTYKKSRRGTAPVDDAATDVIGRLGGNHRVIEFSPYGYDERQFCSPGFDLGVGRLTRAVHGEHPEYHTSDDNLSFVSQRSLEESLAVVRDVVDALDGDETYVSTQPFGEPRLGPRGLFRNVGGLVPPTYEMALLWLLNQSDGTNSLVAIAKRANISFADIRLAADALVTAGLLVPVTSAELAGSRSTVRPMENS
jgi:aminopeptidase-like protein